MVQRFDENTCTVSSGVTGTQQALNTIYAFLLLTLLVTGSAQSWPGALPFPEAGLN